MCGQESTGKSSRVGSTSLTTMFLHLTARWYTKPIMDSILVQVICKISQRETCHCDSVFPLLETVPSAFCPPLFCHALPLGYQREFILICGTGLGKSALPFGWVIWGCLFSMGWVFLKTWLFRWLSVSLPVYLVITLHTSRVFGVSAFYPFFRCGNWI